MKNFIRALVTLIILAALAIGGYAAWSWFSLDNMEQPKLPVTVGGQSLTQIKTDWTVPVFFNLLKRDLHWVNDVAKPDEVKLTDYGLDIVLPNGHDGDIIIKKADEEIFHGNSYEYNSFSFTENGTYTMDITLIRNPSGDDAYGQITFFVNVIIDVPPPPPSPPSLKASSKSVVQGDTLALELTNVPDGETPIAETDLSLTTFVKMGDGRWVAYTGIADSRDPGEYSIAVSFKDFTETIPITVTKGQFNRQDLWIDTSSPSISEANSDAAYKQYRDTIPPYYETADTEIYWDGKFFQPVNGRLSSEYGLLRYTNGGTTPRRHAGIDLACDEGTPIQSPAGGRVVYSDYLLNTGNTLVIEHGGGLKSYYFHLVKRNVAVDDRVEAGQILGEVGTTGYSTGPHLHFELRIGSQNLDPFKFFNGTSGLFGLKNEA